jgi:predicted O-methyltransferase YrrM
VIEAYQAWRHLGVPEKEPEPLNLMSWRICPVRAEIQRTLDDLERQRLDDDSRGRRDRDERMFAVGPDTARFLNTLIHAMRAKRVLEIGGSMGYSTIWMAEAVESNGGQLTTLEYVPEKAAILRGRIADAGVAATVQVREGDALSILPTLSGPWDLVLVDAWKEDYPAYFDLVFPELSVHGLLVADNITYPSPPGAGIEEYLAKARHRADTQSQLIPLGSGLELTIRLAEPRPGG